MAKSAVSELANMISGNILNDTITTTVGNAEAKLQEFKNYEFKCPTAIESIYQI